MKLSPDTLRFSVMAELLTGHPCLVEKTLAPASSSSGADAMTCDARRHLIGPKI